jgi:hypothetical protein
VACGVANESLSFQVIYELLVPDKSHKRTYFSDSVLNVLLITHLPRNQQSLSILAENIQAIAIGVERLYMSDLYASLRPFAMMAPVILAIE